MKLGDAYKPSKYTSKDVSRGPQHGAGFDPVFAHYFFHKITGPLKRKTNTSPDDFLNVDEATKWMDAKQAAKVLGLKEAELSTLTKESLEERWREAYRHRTFARQQEVLVATEVLLEYLDSSAYGKKNRQYYRQVLENARVEIDEELETHRTGQRGSVMLFTGAMMLLGGLIVVFVMVSRRFVTHEDASSIGKRTGEYMLMTFLQPKNTEPKPDYQMRYFNTPTSMEMDQRAGRGDKRFMGAEEVRSMENAASYQEREEAEMLKLFNDERAAAVVDRREAAARASRVAVYLPEDAPATTAKTSQPVSHDSSSSRSGSSGVDGDKKVGFDKMSLREFSNLLASNFGGGSRFQRLTDETSSRAAELQKSKERMG